MMTNQFQHHPRRPAWDIEQKGARRASMHYDHRPWNGSWRCRWPTWLPRTPTCGYGSPTPPCAMGTTSPKPGASGPQP